MKTLKYSIRVNGGEITTHEKTFKTPQERGDFINQLADEGILYDVIGEYNPRYERETIS